MNGKRIVQVQKSQRSEKKYRMRKGLLEWKHTSLLNQTQFSNNIKLLTVFCNIKRYLNDYVLFQLMVICWMGIRNTIILWWDWILTFVEKQNIFYKSLWFQFEKGKTNILSLWHHCIPWNYKWRSFRVLLIFKIDSARYWKRFDFWSSWCECRCFTGISPWPNTNSILV